jgi:hypothetical protein
MNAFKKLIALPFAMMIALMTSTAPCFADELNAKGQLNIDSITVGTTTYSNVLINLGTGWNVVSIGSSSPVCTAPQVLTNGVCVTPALAASPAGYVSQGGLLWMPVSFTPYTYAQASALCAGTINGQTGWRLPTITELTGLTPPIVMGTIATVGLYGSGAMNGQGWALGITWSSTPISAGFHDFVSLYYGYIGADFDTNYHYVTCVR